VTGQLDKAVQVFILLMRVVQTSKAIYIIICDPATCSISCSAEEQSYDYALNKVQMFTQVPLGDIVGI